MSAVIDRMPRRMAVLILAVALVANPTAGHAKSRVHADPGRDVVHVDDNHRVTPAPNRRDGDIIRTRVWHSDSRVRMRVKFAELRRWPRFPRPNAVYTRVVTNEGVRRWIYVKVTNPERGDLHMFRPDGEYARCKVRYSVSYRKNVVTIGFPRTCLSRPRWVRIGLEVLTPPIEGIGWFKDDAWRRGVQETGNNTLSPRIFRG